MKITVSTTIARPIAEVWRWYAVEHVRNHPRWDPEMELEQLSPGPIGLGTRIRRRNRHFDVPIDGEMEIIEWEPEHVMGAQIHDANLDIAGRVTFQSLGEATTRLTIEAQTWHSTRRSARRALFMRVKLGSVGYLKAVNWPCHRPGRGRAPDRVLG